MFSLLKRKRCPACHDKYITYRWKEYNQIYASSLILIKKLRYGELFQCSNCDIYWLLDENPNDKKDLHKINTRNLPFIEKWNAEISQPTTSFLDIFKKIGATEVQDVKIPCKCKTKNNKEREIDFCLVIFVKHPADVLNFKHKEILLINEISMIYESDYALPYVIRRASCYTKEVRMGFAPIQIATKDDNYFIINGPANFFDLDGYKGKDMLLPTSLRKEQKEDKYYSEQPEKITYIIVDRYYYLAELKKITEVLEQEAQ